jgi:hypothetical protein
LQVVRQMTLRASLTHSEQGLELVPQQQKTADIATHRPWNLYPMSIWTSL